MSTTEPIAFPTSMRKDKFICLYAPYSEVIIRTRINQIIYDFRKDYTENVGKDFTQIVRTHTITKPEMLEYARTYFFPNGYADDEI